MGLIQSVFNLYAAKRRRELASQKPAEAQEQVLLSLLSQAAATSFGKEYKFSTISSVAEYQRRVPLRTYADFWETYWKDAFPTITNITWPGTIPYLPVTSGTTTGKTKYIPLTAQMLAANRKAALDMLIAHSMNHPHPDVFGGKTFVLGGSTALIQEAPGVFSGDLSGIVAKNVPWWAKPFYFPPADLALIEDWEEKVDVLAEASFKQKITMVSGVPSWMLIFFEVAAKKKGLSQLDLGALFPDLELIVHGGVNFAPYRERFEQIRGSSLASFREVYPASEGFIAVADGDAAKGMRLNCDHGIFFEFVPLEELASPHPTRHWVETLELGVNYAVVLTTCAGLWSYVLGDTVKFLQRKPPKLLVTGRTSYTLSAFGEHLIGEEIEDAVSSAAAAISRTVTDYSVGAIFPSREGELGGHLFVVEFADDSDLSTAGQERFIEVLDKRLSDRNDDYRAHRAEGFGMNAPRLLVVKPGGFAEWMKSRGKLGGQHKVPRIINDEVLFKNLKLFMETSHQKGGGETVSQVQTS